MVSLTTFNLSRVLCYLWTTLTVEAIHGYTCSVRSFAGAEDERSFSWKSVLDLGTHSVDTLFHKIIVIKNLLGQSLVILIKYSNLAIIPLSRERIDTSDIIWPLSVGEKSLLQQSGVLVIQDNRPCELNSFEWFKDSLLSAVSTHLMGKASELW